MKLKRIRKTSAQELTLNTGAVVLISYSTPVAAFLPGDGWYKTEKKWSSTTSKQVNQWLKENDVFDLAKTKPQTFFDSLIGD
jgi:hypothetical protein